MKFLKFILAFIVNLFMIGCYYNQSPFKDTDFSKAEIKTEVVEIDSGFGAVIWVDGKRYINLYTIPHVDGYKHFPDQKKAQQAADMVVAKMRKNIIPPSLSKEEVKEMGLYEGN